MTILDERYDSDPGDPKAPACGTSMRNCNSSAVTTRETVMNLATIIWGVILPFIITWFTAKWLGLRFRRWWGSSVAILVSCLSGIIIPVIIYAVIALMYGYPVGPYGNLGISIIITPFISMWAVIKARSLE